MGDKGDRQMCLRPQGEEADEDIDQSASMDPEGQNREWALQGGEVHGVANEQWSDGASRTNVPEQQGEETRHGSEERREVRKGAKDSKKGRSERQSQRRPKRKRLLKKRTREGGSKGGKAATVPEDADTND